MLVLPVKCSKTHWPQIVNRRHEKLCRRRRDRLLRIYDVCVRLQRLASVADSIGDVMQLRIKSKLICVDRKNLSYSGGLDVEEDISTYSSWPKHSGSQVPASILTVSSFFSFGVTY